MQERKRNRLCNYDYGQNGAYFIAICTKDRKQILSKIVGDDAYIVPKPYGLVVEKYIRNVPQIEKYVIMPDHIHMLIRLDQGSMWASTPTAKKYRFGRRGGYCNSHEECDCQYCPLNQSADNERNRRAYFPTLIL